MRSSVYTNSEFVSILCGDKRILLLTFPRMPDANSPPGRFFLALEVGPHTKPGKSALGTRLGQTEKFPPYSCRLLLITTLVEWLHRGKTGQSILIIAIVSITANNKPFLDVVHHWFCLLQWVIWVTKPIYISLPSVTDLKVPLLCIVKLYTQVVSDYWQMMIAVLKIKLFLES